MTRREISNAIGRRADPANAFVREVMLSVETVDAATTMHEANELLRRGSHRVVVVDDEGRALGVVTGVKTSLADRVRAAVTRTSP